LHPPADRGALARRTNLTAELFVGLYALAILLSASLLFLVQPMFARMVLPLLGGSPAVWSTAVVFYQVVLLAGYAYAYAVTRWVSVRPQRLLHVGLVALPVLVLPIRIPDGWTPPLTEQPMFWLLALLAVSVGLPFFVVSSTTPLLQRWFAAGRRTSARDPYPLYAVSNLGSLLALLAYPLIVERWLPLRDQSRWWTWGYVGLTVVVTACAAAIWPRSAAPTTSTSSTSSSASTNSIGAPAAVAGEAAPITWRDRVRWVALAAMPVSFMLSVTTYISTDISAIPLLWVIPLAWYLLTFILTFAPRPIVPQAPLIRVCPIVLALLACLLATARDVTSWPLILAHLAAFALAALVAHGELARRRPGVSRLTEFYFWIALGGALGGIFNAVVAPLIFARVEEYPLTLMLAALLLPPVAVAAASAEDTPRQRRRPGPRTRKKNTAATRVWRLSRTQWLDLLLPAAVGALVVALVRGLLESDEGLTWTSRLIAFGTPALISLAFSRRPLRFALSLGAIMLGSALYSGKGTYLHTERTFFGVSRVLLFSGGGYHLLEHGNTLHGAQSLEPLRQREPLTYYHPTGPLGDIFANVRAHPAGDRVAVVGLGAGSVACYRQPSQTWTFYEIDPAVERIASNPRFFTYLKDCAPDARIVVGDARIRLAEAAKSEYALIVLDAYSSDAIPIHLLTKEAFALYLDKLAPGGALALNVSNRQIDLATILANVAKELQLAYRARADQQLSEAEQNRGKLASQWAVLARTTDDLGSLATDPRWVLPQSRPGTSVWTDDLNNLLSVLNWTR
jgi:hypothetical protein